MFIMLPPLLYGQNKLVEESIIYSSDISSYKKKIEKTIFFDTETNLPVFELILDTARSSKMYTSYYFRKRLREVSTEISYIGGNESLRKYQDSLYWENYNGDEQNASCLYTILFDRKLKIREIKIVKRAGYNNSKYNYDKLIKKILLSTEGSWQKTNNALSEEWYFRFSTVWHNHLRNKHLTEHLRNNSNELATVRFSAFCGAMLSNNSFLMQR